MNAKFTHGYVITARYESTRFPGKILSDFDGTTPLEVVIQRCLLGDLHPLFLAIGDTELNDELALIGSKMGVEVFRGPTQNKLSRWIACAKEKDLTHVTIVEADDIFFDWEQMRESATQLFETESLAVIVPHLRSEAGAGEVGMSCTLSFLQQGMVHFGLEDPNRVVDVVAWTRMAETLGVKSLAANSPFSHLPEVRTTLDYEEDLEILIPVARAIGTSANRTAIENYLQERQDLRGLMLELNKRFVNNKRSAEEQ